MKTDPHIKNIAQKILSKTKISPDEQFGSIMAILMIISISLTLIRILQECNKTKIASTNSAEEKFSIYKDQIKEYCNNRGWFTKMRIKKVLRQNMPKEQYIKYSLQLLNAFLDIGESLTEEEILTLVEKANV
jgi:hypothetical protein